MGMPLTAEQLPVLAWMLHREGVALNGNCADMGVLTYLSTHLIERRFAHSDLCVQLKVEREYAKSRGGVLAHQMGFGKTALIIALVALCRRTKTVASGAVAGDAETDLDSRAYRAGTLIV